MGHMKNYSVGDAVAHFRRRNGFRVLHPMGYDAFGLPAENHAIRTGEHPRDSTAASIAAFQVQMRQWGISIDWSREFGTHEPRYYRWTQWLFLRLLERGLAYRKEAAVNWCPKDATVLANEQVIDGRCERCGTLVEARQLEQWFFRITDYADRLLDDLAEHRLAAARRDDAAQLDRPLARAPRSTFAVPRDGHGVPDLHHAPGHAVRRDVLRDGARASGRPAPRRGHRARAGGPRLRQPCADREPGGARLDRAREDGRAARAHGRQPRQRRAHPDVGRRLRAHGVRHRARSWRCRATTSATSPSPSASASRSGASWRAATSCRTPATGRSSNSDPRFDGMPNREALGAIVDWLDDGGPRPPLGQLPPARLAAVAPALLGLPDPGRLLRRLRHRPGARRRAAGAAARRHRLQAQGPLAAGDGRGVAAHDVPALRRARAARDGHDGHLRGLLVVLPALLRRAQRRGAVGPRGRRRSGCPSTSTSAAWSTRSCTSCTRASS